MQETQVPSSTEKDTIKMFATTWCGDCRMAKRWLDSHNIPYEYINIEHDEQAAEYVMQVNRGMRTVPTIVFPDGSVLVEPSVRDLAAKFSMR
jgi:mycoredoxin